MVKVGSVSVSVIRVKFSLYKETVGKVIRWRTITEFLVEVVGERNIVCFEIPLENNVIGHIRDSFVSVFTYNDFINDIVESAGHLTVFVVCYRTDTRFMIAAADFNKCFLNF